MTHKFFNIQLTSPLNYSTTMDSIGKALQALTLQDKPNISATAREYNVDRSTLSRRFKKGSVSRQTKCENQGLLPLQQERTLVLYINKLTENGIPPTPSMIHNFVNDIVQKQPGKGWSHRFCKRWKQTLDSKFLTTYDSTRFKADSEHSYKLYFDLVERKIAEYSVETYNMYNMDEKGFLIGFLTKSKRVFTKATFEKKRLLGAIRDGNRDWITVLATICADGTWIAPALIYQAVTGNLQDSWLQDFDGRGDKAFIASSATGWTNDELGMQWLEKVFDRETKKKARNGRDYRLLFVDGHGSHLNMEFLRYCQTNRILVAVYPPHSTHRLQPLDVSLFAPLAIYYSEALQQFIHECQGISAVQKRDFFRFFNEAYPRAFSDSNIASGWSKTGLHPFNPGAILDIFDQKVASRPSTQASSSSSALLAISASDWRRIRRYLQDAVHDAVGVHQDRLQKLSNTMINITTENAVLKAENQGFKNALYLEKKRRKRGKPVFNFRDQEGGGATFYCPNKIQQQLDFNADQETQKQHDKVQKDTLAKDRKLQQQVKQLAIEQRKIDRQDQAEAKKQAVIAKAAQKEQAIEAQTASRQLQETLQASVKKSKRQAAAPVVQQSPSRQRNKVINQEVLDQPNLRAPRIRKAPRHLADYDIDF